MRFIVLSAILSLGLLFGRTNALDNGLALTPPMGWRSWNLYGGDINQRLFLSMMDALVDRRRLVDGVPTSLCDIGYCDIGIDLGWELCGSYGPDKYTFHTETGYPIVDQNRFPDLKEFTNYAHARGLTAGWYFNGCACADHCGSNDDHGDKITKCYAGDIGALYEYGFDNVKIDGCGKQRSFDVYNTYINGTGKPTVVENCHWGQTLPTATWCPWHFYRTSGDIVANYGSILSNLQSTIPLAEQGLSSPGCWAYPDMLEVGIVNGVHGGDDSGLNDEETRSHFGAWCIVSSPLYISFDLYNDTVVDRVWNLITNKEAIAINHAWAGHSGSPFSISSTKVTKYWTDSEEVTRSINIGSYVFFYKPLATDGSYYAILLMNHDTRPQDLSFNFTQVPKISCSTVIIRDIWKKADIGKFANAYTASAVAPHDSVFLTIKCIQKEEAEEAVY